MINRTDVFASDSKSPSASSNHSEFFSITDHFGFLCAVLIIVVWR